MANKTQEETNSAKSYWLAVTESSEQHPSVMDATTKAILNFASPLLENAVVSDAFGTMHSALWYAMCMYVEAETLVNKQNNPQATNFLAQCSLMVALEESCYAGSTWSYGSRLLFDLKKAGIKLGRALIAAFLAQEGDWSNNKSKGDLLEGNAIAVGIYCSRLRVLSMSLAGARSSDNGEAMKEISVTQELKTLDDIFGYYLNEFAVPYLESVGSKDAKKQVEAFQNYLRQQSDFYTAPCSTKYHLSRDGGLAEHTYHVLMQMLWQTLPATVEQLGACVLAAIGHDLCKIGVYKKQWRNVKVYIQDGEVPPSGVQIKTEPDEQQYYYEPEKYFVFNDAMPFGHGRKSAYILLGFFPEIGADVYAAVDGHMADPSANKNYLKLFAENAMSLNLHIADALATYIDEYNQ